MKKPCSITYKGKKYSDTEFKAFLLNGGLDALVSEGAVNLKAKNKQATFAEIAKDFVPETVKDHVADFFLGGGFIRTESFNRFGDANKIKGTSSGVIYLRKNGTPVDQLASDIQRMEGFEGVDEKEITEAIVDFVQDQDKGYREYIKNRVNEQTQAPEDSADEFYTQMYGMPTPEQLDGLSEGNQKEQVEYSQELDDYFNSFTDEEIDKWYNEKQPLFETDIQLIIQEVENEIKTNETTGNNQRPLKREETTVDKKPKAGQSAKLSDEQVTQRNDSLKMSWPQFSIKYPKLTNDNYQELRSLAVRDKKAGAMRFAADEKKYSPLLKSGKVKGKRIDVAPIEGQEPKKLSEIILDLSKGIKKDLLVSKKPSKRRSLGSYNPTNAATKVRYNNDLDVTAHEIGHALDDRYGILSNIPDSELGAIKAELLPFSEFGSTPPKNHPNAEQYILGEGIAEWIRAYVVNPAEAERQAPKFTTWFKSTVPADIQKGIDQFGTDVRTFSGATNIQKVKAAIDFNASKQRGSIFEFLKPTTTNEDGYRLTFFDKVATKFLNPMRALGVMVDFARGQKGITEEILPEKDPRILAKLLLGFNDKIDNMLEHGLVDARNQRIKDSVTDKPMTLEWLLEPFDATDQKTLEAESQEMVSVMVAERIAEKYGQYILDNQKAKAEGKPIPHPNFENLVNVGGGIFRNMDVVNGVLEDFSQLKETNPEKYARMLEGMRRYREYADQMLRYQVEKGRLSIDDYQTIKSENLYYVGLGRILDASPNEEIIGSKRESGALGSISNLNKFKGSDRMIKNPYEFMLETMYKTIKEADRNEVMQSIVELVSAERGMYEDDVNKLGTAMREASPDDPNTITVFINGEKKTYQFDDDIYAALKNLQDLSYNLPWVATALPSLLRWSVTHFPVFAARNRVRDFQSRLILSKSGTKFQDFKKPQDIKDRYQLFGAGQAGYYLTEEGFYYKRLQQATEDLAGTNTIVVNPSHMGQRGWDAYTKLLASSERATRLEEYNAAYRKAKGQGLDDYNANLYAAYQARDLMDFAVLGTWMRYINQVVPFSNAAVQGLRKMVNTANEDPAGFATRLILFSVIPALLTRLMAAAMGDDDDEWYRQLPAYQRDLFYNFKIGDNKILAIPKPYELGMIGSFTDRLVDRIIYDDKKAFDGHGGTVARSFFPFDEGTLFNISGAGPFVEVAANYDSFRKRHVVPTYEEKKLVELRNTEYASRLGKSAQNLFGTDARQADFLIKRLTSYYGDLAIKVSDIGRDDKQGAGLELTGFIKPESAIYSRDVSWVMERADEYGISELPFYVKHNTLLSDYRTIRDMERAYYSATTDHDKSQIAQTIRDYGKKVRESWESGLLEQYKTELLEAKKK